MAFADVFDSKVVNNLNEQQRPPVVSPKPWCGGALVITMLGQSRGEEVIG